MDQLGTPFSGYLTHVEGFPRGSDGKESVCNVGGLGSIPGLGRSPGKEKGYPLQYSGLLLLLQLSRFSRVRLCATP